ncbi:glycosyltransferase involved in cell wall biosynthesis [Catalinimonas alkaloidigena]|uniref:glycosyltransferase family 2 protein n=1 Tax=Catalinimonas alkaloidigena TaxID=1075417 RepID=UPI0024069946|nr:glycosyltransferase family 2 protein [Catalinimonas alkaloidigena]MDF9799668.1 glycosyltransferase involved in cell wall biosynthesis [Catalinimonas alkaloidigena]
MKLIKISIVTPSFNQAEYIEEAIQSILNQNYPNFEHIIVDNCSTDGTIKILNKYPHLKYISEPDEGQSDAINKGFKRATGDVIGWLNADDYYYPDTFAKVNEQFANNKVDAIYSNVKFVNAEGKMIRSLRSHIPVRWMGYFLTFIQSTSFFFRRRIIEDNNLLDKDLFQCMDRDFFVRLLYRGYKFKFVNAYFAAFRWHQSNKSVSKSYSETSIKEHFYIINKNTSYSIESSRLNKFIYKVIVVLFVKPVRRTLKIISIFK